MYQGNWKCSSCGGAITELPFQPRSESGLTCRACYAGSKSKASAPAEPEVEHMTAADEAPPIPDDAAPAGEAPPHADFDGATAPAEKPKFTGDWRCATCDGPITSLPFEPRDVTNLKCIDCFKKSKA